MVCALLDLDNGHVSLECETSDMAALMAAIETRYGRLKVTPMAVSAVYHFGDSRFTYSDDWAEPCLISGSPAGDAILRQLFLDLTSAERTASR